MSFNSEKIKSFIIVYSTSVIKKINMALYFKNLFESKKLKHILIESEDYLKFLNSSLTGFSRTNPVPYIIATLYI